MAKCEVCGNDYDKSFAVTLGGKTGTSMRSNARSTPSRRNARIAAAGSSDTAWKRAARSTAARIVRNTKACAASATASEVSRS